MSTRGAPCCARLKRHVKSPASVLASNVAYALRRFSKQSPPSDLVYLQSSALLDTLGAVMRSGEQPITAVVVSSSPDLLRRAQPLLRGAALHLDLNSQIDEPNNNLGGAIIDYHNSELGTAEALVAHRATAQARNAASHSFAGAPKKAQLLCQECPPSRRSTAGGACDAARPAR